MTSAPTDPNRWLPSAAVVLSSALVGVAVFLGVLLYGPAPQNDSDELVYLAPGGAETRDEHRGQTIRAIARGQDDLAIETLQWHLREDPEFGWAQRLLYQLALRDSSRAELASAAQQSLRTLPPAELTDDSWRWDRRTQILQLLLLAQPEQAEQIAAENIVSIRANEQIGASNRAFLVAAVYAVAGQDDKAVQSLVAAYDDAGYADLRWLQRSPDLDGLRDRADFQALLARMAADLERARADRLPPVAPDAAVSDMDSESDAESGTGVDDRSDAGTGIDP